MVEMMWAAMLTRPGQRLEIRRVPVPEPGQGELLVRLEASGVCHTDVHVRGASDFPGGAPRPLILGHEGIGKVVTQGPGATRIPLGARVGVPWLHDTCSHCRECLTGWESFCATHRAHGYTVHGSFAEYAVVKEAYTLAIPDQLEPAEAAPLMCAGVTAYGAVRKAALEPGKRCAVFGCGGLGQYAIQLAKLTGATVIAIDANPAKLEAARALGAAETYLAGPEAGTKIRAAGGADACLNFAPTPRVWPTIAEAINPLGWIISVAMVAEPVPLVLEWLTYNGVRITGTSVGTRQELMDLVAIAAHHGLRIPMERIALGEVDAGLDRLERGEVEGRLVIDLARGLPRA
ncbi:MAG: alcohol dehydrogenase catalytic protein [Rhodospirillales bacterium]|nr:alcohol dehydrogenase catalytic protein [Rhodospirillales bacterium]